MSDAKLRALERAWRASGSETDQLAYLQAGLRAGALTTERLELAAFLGDRGSWLALGRSETEWAFKPPREVKRLLKDLSAWGSETWLRGFVVGVRVVLDGLEPSDDHRAHLEPALESAEAWTNEPGAETAQAAASAAASLQGGLPPELGAGFRDTPESPEQCAQLLAWRAADWASRGETADPVDLAEGVEWVGGLSEAGLARSICEGLVPWVLGSDVSTLAVDEDQLAWTRHYQAKRAGTLEPLARGAFAAAVREVLGGENARSTLEDWGQRTSVNCAVVLADLVLPICDRMLPDADWPHTAAAAARAWLECPCAEHAAAAKLHSRASSHPDRLEEIALARSNSPLLGRHYRDIDQIVSRAAEAAAAKNDRAASRAAVDAVLNTQALASALPAEQGRALLGRFGEGLAAWVAAQSDPRLLELSARAQAAEPPGPLQPNPRTDRRKRSIVVSRCVQPAVVFYQPQGTFRGSGFTHTLPVVRSLPVAAPLAEHGVLAEEVLRYSGATGIHVNDAERISVDEETAAARALQAGRRRNLHRTTVHLTDGARHRELQTWVRRRDYSTPEGKPRHFATSAGSEGLGQAILEALEVDLSPPETESPKKTQAAKKSQAKKRR